MYLTCRVCKDSAQLKAKPAFVVTVCHSFVRLYSSSDITYSQQLHSSRDVSPGNLGYLVSVIPSNAVCSEEEQHSIILLNKSFHILKHFHIILTTCLVVVNRKGSLSAFGRNFRFQLLPKHFGRISLSAERALTAEMLNFGQKRVISAEMWSFGRNNLIISCRKRLISAEMEYFGRKPKESPFG